MNQFHPVTYLLTTGSGLLLLLMACPGVGQVSQEPRFHPRPGALTEARLALLDVVARELKLSPDQHSRIAEINDTLEKIRQEVRQTAEPTSRSRRLLELDLQANEDVRDLLDKTQRRRLWGIWMQVNGGETLDDAEVAAALALTAEQARNLDTARARNSREFNEALQMHSARSASESRAAYEEHRRRSQERLLSVLTRDQRERFSDLQGERVEIDAARALDRFWPRNPLSETPPPEKAGLVPTDDVRSEQISVLTRAKLAAHPFVQRELKLSPSQSSTAMLIYENLRHRQAELLNATDTDRAVAAEARLKQAAERAARQLDLLLDRLQQPRLQQLDVQSLGGYALGRANIARELELTTEQISQIDDINVSTTAAKRAIYVKSPKPLPPDVRAKLVAIDRQGYKRALDVLTTEQREEFLNLRGPESDIDLFDVALGSDD